MKYQCNSCGKVYDRQRDANDCHPDVIEIPDDEAKPLTEDEEAFEADVGAALAAGARDWMEAAKGGPP